MQESTRQETTYTREQFYDKLWSEPTIHIAKELGCSDVLIGKICKDYDIPKPYLGYWAKIEHGKKASKTPLPKNDDPRIQILTFRVGPPPTQPAPDPEGEYDPDIQEQLAKARALEPLTVAEALRNPHHMVAAARDRLKAESVPAHLRRYDGVRRPTLSVDVSAAVASRALRILDALIKRIEKIGGKIEIRPERWNAHRADTYVSFGGAEASAIRLREKRSQVRVPRKEGDPTWGNRTDLMPTGLLILDNGSVDGVLLQDTPKEKRIEAGLNNLLIDLVKMAGDRSIRRREEEVARRRKMEMDIRRLDLRKRQEAEQARVDELVRDAKSWQRSRLIREYIDGLGILLVERDGAIPIAGDTATYMRWAYQQADRLDPLRPSPVSILDERI